MSDSYQAIYDAVRSRISNGDVGRAVGDAARNAFDISHTVEMLRCDFQTVAYEMRRPSVLFRPNLSMDGNQWCALYGENLQSGVAGFGDTPALAMADFDAAWNKKLLCTDSAPSDFESTHPEGCTCSWCHVPTEALVSGETELQYIERIAMLAHEAYCGENGLSSVAWASEKEQRKWMAVAKAVSDDITMGSELQREGPKGMSGA